MILSTHACTRSAPVPAMGWIVFPSTPQKGYAGVLNPGALEHDSIGRWVFTEGIKLRWGHRVGPDPIWLVSLYKGEIGLQTLTRWGHSAKMKAEMCESSNPSNCQQTTRSWWRGLKRLSTFSGGVNSDDRHLNLRLAACRGISWSFKSPSLWSFLLSLSKEGFRIHTHTQTQGENGGSDL